MEPNISYSKRGLLSLKDFDIDISNLSYNEINKIGNEIATEIVLSGTNCNGFCHFLAWRISKIQGKLSEKRVVSIINMYGNGIFLARRASTKEDKSGIDVIVSYRKKQKILLLQVKSSKSEYKKKYRSYQTKEIDTILSSFNRSNIDIWKDFLSIFVRNIKANS